MWIIDYQIKTKRHHTNNILAIGIIPIVLQLDCYGVWVSKDELTQYQPVTDGTLVCKKQTSFYQFFGVYWLNPL